LIFSDEKNYTRRFKKKDLNILNVNKNFIISLRTFWELFLALAGQDAPSPNLVLIANHLLTDVSNKFASSCTLTTISCSLIRELRTKPKPPSPSQNNSTREEMAKIGIKKRVGN
jgi:hypothetical protein